MVWNAQNSFSQFAGNVPVGGENIAVRTSGNIAAGGAYNIAAQGAHNIAARAGRNIAAHNIAAHSAANIAANIAAWRMAGLDGGAGLPPPGHTGAGDPSGSGFAGGYGPVDRWEYATPAALAPVPWTLDFAIGPGWPSFPVDLRINPYAFEPPLQWQTGDWDPGLRFWSLPFDPQLTEWLQDLDLSSPSVMAAREFAASTCRAPGAPGQPARGWQATAMPDARCWLQQQLDDDKDLTGWRPILPPHPRTTVSAQDWAALAPADRAGQEQQWQRDCDTANDRAWAVVNAELVELIDLMRDDRARYLPELSLQSSQIVPYLVHLLRIDPATKPWTVELMHCGSAIGNLVKMQYKSVYRRVRPSTLCPGLVPPWGPPQHPAFPSGHSLVTHLMVLLLLQVPGIAQRFGIFNTTPANGQPAQFGREVDLRAEIFDDGAPSYGSDQKSPLLWLAWRIAKGRERLGVHYPSDSAASRKLAAGLVLWCQDSETAQQLPTLHRVLALAAAEWPPQALRPRAPPAEPPAPAPAPEPVATVPKSGRAA